MSDTLASRLRPCGPLIDAGAADRARERLAEAASEHGWVKVLEGAWPALAPVFSASPYLFGLARRWPDILRATLEESPDTRLTAVIAAIPELNANPA